MNREEAIKHLEEWKEIISNGRRKEVIDMAIEALEYLEINKQTIDLINVFSESFKCDPSMIKLKNEWIPCSERLPKEKQEVYVTVYFTEGDTGRAYGYVDGFGKWHLYSTVEGTLNSGYEVTAWMPLPEPYKAESEE